MGGSLRHLPQISLTLPPGIGGTNPRHSFFCPARGDMAGAAIPIENRPMGVGFQEAHLRIGVTSIANFIQPILRHGFERGTVRIVTCDALTRSERRVGYLRFLGRLE